MDLDVDVDVDADLDADTDVVFKDSALVSFKLNVKNLKKNLSIYSSRSCALSKANFQSGRSVPSLSLYSSQASSQNLN